MLVDELKERVPEQLQFTPEFNTMLQLIKDKGFRQKAAFQMFLDTEMKESRDWLEKSKSQPATLSRERRMRTRKLKFFSLIKQKFLTYL